MVKLIEMQKLKVALEGYALKDIIPDTDGTFKMVFTRGACPEKLHVVCVKNSKFTEMRIMEPIEAYCQNLMKSAGE